MKVSVIVPNHDRDLSVLMKSLPYGIEFIEVNLGLERSRQRNIGIEKAEGEALLILDSDQSISKGLIQECIQLVEKGFSSVYIPEVIVATSFFGRIRKFEREFYTGTAIDVPRFVLKSACPMFDETLSGPEDADWGNRIPGLRTISKNVLFHHDDISFMEYCRKKAYYTKSMKRYAAKWPEDKCLKIWYRCFWVFIENWKWMKILRHPILSLGILFLLIIRGVIYYGNR
jgi:glycosyltransferase involved in cell wall biosynthesis